MFTDFLTQPLSFSFMQNALIEIILLSLLTGTVGTIIVLRNLAFISEALSHAIFPGVVISFIFKINIFIGAFVAGLITIIGINSVSRKKNIGENTAIGILFSFSFAVGVVLISSLKNFKSDLSTFLVGNILGVSLEDILITGICSFIILSTYFIYRREIIISSFDRQFARSIGLKVKHFDFIVYLSILITVIVSIQAIGNILVIALLIIPPATARLTIKKISHMFILSTIYTLLIGVIGLYISYYLNLAAGGTIVVLCACWFFIVFVFKKLNYI